MLIELTINIDGNTIGERVRQIRRARDMTQDDLGDALGLARTAIAKVELGLRRLTADELFRTADLLGVPVEMLRPGS